MRAVMRPRAAAAPAVQQSINIFYPPGPQRQTRRTLLQPVNGTDRRRRTDIRTDIVPFHSDNKPNYAIYCMFHNNVQIGIRTTKLQSADTGMMSVLIRTVYGKQMKVHTCSAERERERAVIDERRSACLPAGRVLCISRSAACRGGAAVRRKVWLPFRNVGQSVKARNEWIVPGRSWSYHVAAAVIGTDRLRGDLTNPAEQYRSRSSFSVYSRLSTKYHRSTMQ